MEGAMKNWRFTTKALFRKRYKKYSHRLLAIKIFNRN